MESIESNFQTRRYNKTFSKAAEARQAPFTPIIASCDAVLDREAAIYIKQLGVYVLKKWKSQYSNTVNWLRARLQMFILRSVSLCLSGFKTKWGGTSAGPSDRVNMPPISH